MLILRGSHWLTSQLWFVELTLGQANNLEDKKQKQVFEVSSRSNEIFRCIITNF